MGIGLMQKEFNIKNLLYSKINRKITLLFVIVGLIAPTLAIFCFYTTTVSSFPEYISDSQIILLKIIAVIIIILISINAGIIGFFVSQSISKPIKQLYNATLELEKGNYDVIVDIKTDDEIEELGHAFNITTTALSKMEQEKKEIDDAKTEFLSITSHELRSPMTPMKAQLQMLKEGYFGKLNKKQIESLSIIIRNSERLDNIIADFLEISRIEAARLKFDFRQTDVVQLVKETIIFMQGFAKEKNITLVEKVKNLPFIQADPDRISQVLRNLINNAIKFSKENSEIEISAELNNNYILFGVKDYGCGLSAENQVRVFEPFYQVESSDRRKHGGTGLGLTICRGIVESQKGKIWVESQIRKGCRFYFTVPLNPVKNIEPIKVLFSQKDVIERKIYDEFSTILGPLGEVEFNELKNKNSLSKDDLIGYIDSLTGLYILAPEKSNEFKNKIKEIFGEEKETIIKKKNDMPFGELGDVVLKRS
jgi:signal transduction histidine kinase